MDSEIRVFASSSSSLSLRLRLCLSPCLPHSLSLRENIWQPKSRQKLTDDTSREDNLFSSSSRREVCTQSKVAFHSRRPLLKMVRELTWPCRFALCRINRHRIVVILPMFTFVLLVFLSVNHNISRGKRIKNFDMYPSPPYSNLSPCQFIQTADLGVDRLYCPDVRHKGSTKHRQAQLVLTRMLKVFDLIARKYKLRYWLYRGTLLGAVRHEGHNPFDDDVDIALLREDYAKFINEGAKELPQDMFLQTEKSDPHWKVVSYSNMLGKIRDLNSCYNYCLTHGCKHRDGLQIDLFVIDQDTEEQLVEWFWHPSWFLRYMFGPLRRPYSDVFPLKEQLFDGFSFPIPSKWDKILKNWYGDFMNIPQNAPVSHELTEPQRGCRT